MEQKWREETKPLVLDGGIHMPYSWTIGRTGSLFFIELRDNCRLWASPCNHCEEVWIPPRLRCPSCFRLISEDEWIEVGPDGILKNFTVIRNSRPALPHSPPVVYGIIQLEGATRNLTHLLNPDDLENLRVGQRVKAVFEGSRQGSVLDISYFTSV